MLFYEMPSPQWQFFSLYLTRGFEWGTGYLDRYRYLPHLFTEWWLSWVNLNSDEQLPSAFDTLSPSDTPCNNFWKKKSIKLQKCCGIHGSMTILASCSHGFTSDHKHEKLLATSYTFNCLCPFLYWLTSRVKWRAETYLKTNYWFRKKHNGAYLFGIHWQP